MPASRPTATSAQVVFEDIGDSALQFSVRARLRDGVRRLSAETALRTQAVKTLRERGIDLASPQRSVRLRDLEGVRAFLVRLAEERARRSDAEDERCGGGTAAQAQRRLMDEERGVGPPTLSPRGRRARAARGAPAPRPTASRWGAHRGASSRSARPSPRSTRSEPSSMRASAASILATSLRWRSRARSSSARSVSDVARSARSACWVDSSCSPTSVSRVWRMISSFQATQLLAEVHPLALVHERLVLGWTVVRRQHNRRRLGACRHLFPRNLLLYAACLSAGFFSWPSCCDRFAFGCSGAVALGRTRGFRAGH